MNFKKLLTLILILIFAGNLSAQIESKGVPYIKNYNTADYDGNNQTFSVVQDDRGIMYFANQNNILEFDGNSWRKIFLPGDPAIYSLAKGKNGKIFVGANGEFGYLSVLPDGNIKYKSLIDKVKKEKRNFTKVDFIIKGKDEEIIFLTPLDLYIYKNDTVKTIKTHNEKNIFIRPFKVRDRLFFSEKGYGILEYINGKLELLKGTEKFAFKWVVAMFPRGKKDIYFNVFRDSIYIYSNKRIKSFEKDPLLKNIYSSSIYEKYYLGGLYSKGLIVTDKDLNIIKHLSESNGLQNNTVYNVFPDKDNDIWLGTNNGISVVFPNLPYSVFSESSNLTGAVYASKLLNNKLYIGSSIGMFYKDFSKKNSIEGEKFELLDYAKGNKQIWKIEVINNSLLCASSDGLLEIKDSILSLVGNQETSIKSFIQLKNNPNYLLTTGGTGLLLFEYIDGKWEFKNSIKNFKGNNWYIVEDENNTFWLSDKTKGITHLKINAEMDSVEKETLLTKENGLPETQNNYVFEINNRIVFATSSGLYFFDNNKNKFLKDPKFENIFNDKSITKLHQTKSGDIWFKEELNDSKIKNKKHWELGLVKKTDTGYTIIKKPFYKLKNRINHINQISDNELIIGTEAGFVLYNSDAVHSFDKPFNALIRKVEFVKNDSVLFGGAHIDANNKISNLQNVENIPQIPYKFNNLRFSFAAVFYEEPEKTQYKFILKGNDGEWSDWKFKTDKEYSNLAPGSYTMIVKAKNLYETESNIAEYTFQILPPWYKTIWAYIGYFILFVLFIYAIIQLSVARLKKQKENLEAIVEERTQEILIQKEEIEAKNDTLSEQNEQIIQKNESITASINYAKRIQEAMLPVKENISKHLTENFLLFKPRDIVSGDFYWYAEKDNKVIYTAVDCTGHGVPGALMSMIGSEILGTILNEGITEAGKILEKMNEYVIKALKQETEGFSQDGMDISLCVIDKKNKTVEYAGAKNPLVYITDGKLTQVKASRYGIGGYTEKKKVYESHLIKYESPTWFYMFSDGYPDQFGGPKDRKFMIKRLKNLLLDIHYKPMQEQHDILDKTIEEWMENTNQTDDIIVTGFKL